MAFALLIASRTSATAQISKTLATNIATFEASMDSLAWESIAASRCGAITSGAPGNRAVDYIADLSRGVPREPAGGVLNQERIYAGRGFTVDAIRLQSRIRGAMVRGYLGAPVVQDSLQPMAVVLTGPGVIGPQAFGIRLAGDDSLIQYPKADLFFGLAQELMKSGMRVLVLELSFDITRWPLLPWQDLMRGGTAYAIRNPGTSPAAPMIAQLMGAIDFASRSAPRGIVLVGWGDGAQIANLVAADRRISALVRLAGPVDRPRARRSASGIKMGPAILAGDCGVSEVDLARAVVPKPMLIMHYSDRVYRPFADAFVSAAVADSIGALYAAHGQQAAFTSITLKGNDPWQGRLSQWLADERVGTGLTNVAEIGGASDARVGVLPTQAILGAIFTNEGALVRGGCTQLGAGRRAVQEGDAQRARDPLSTLLRTQVHVGTALSRVSWSVDTLGATPAFTVLAYRGSDAGQVVSGIAAVPRTQLAHYPLIVSYNGNDGAASLLDRTDRRYPFEYLNAYGAVLAENGFVVVIPYVANWFPDGATSLLTMRTGEPFAAWSVLLTNYRDGLSFALSQLPIDSTLVTGYGISYGGEAALMHAALDNRVSRVLYSNPISTPAAVFSTPDAAGLTTWQNTICHFETALRTRFIAPRELIWENGVGDANGQAQDPMEEVRAVSAFYESLGAGDRFSFVRHGGGHATRPTGQLLNLLLRR